MLPQYKMVLINGILSAILLLALTIYSYIFKKRINLLYLLILISILPVISIFRAGTYESGDLSLHTERLMSFYNSLVNYHLIPRWTPEFNAGYGDPHFLFAYFLPYLFGSILHHIGFSFLLSLKLLLAISFISSGITMFFWAKEELDKKSGFVAAIFYLFMPYHLIDMHFRATIAENLSFVFLPLILLAIKKVVEERNKIWFVTLSINISLLILSHQAISIIFLPIIILYSLFVFYGIGKKRIKNLIYCFTSVLLGFLIASFYWLPAVSLAKFTQHGSNPTLISFPNLTELLYSPWRFGFLFQGHKGELSYLIGYTQLFVILLSAYLLSKNAFKKKLKHLLLFFLIIFSVLFLMVLSVSKPIWYVIPLLEYSQFSTRLFVPLALCISIIAGIIVKKINKNWFIVILCFLTIFYTILNWGNRRTIPEISDSYLKEEFKRNPDISGLEPTSPIWADLNKSKLRIIPMKSIEIIKGDAIVNNGIRTPINHRYRIVASFGIEVKENTLFFPGWIVFAGNKPIFVDYKNPKSPGVITFKLNKGAYNVQVKFTDLPIIIFAKWLSLISLAAITIYAFFPKKILKLNFPKL